MTRTLADVQAHMRDTLAPDPSTVTAAEALLDAGLGQLNGTPPAANRLVYSALTIRGNENAHMYWTGDETVGDPGALFLERAAVLAYLDVLRESGTADAAAYVVHYGSGDWAAFIDL